MVNSYLVIESKYNTIKILCNVFLRLRLVPNIFNELLEKNVNFSKEVSDYLLVNVKVMVVKWNIN